MLYDFEFSPVSFNSEDGLYLNVDNIKKTTLDHIIDHGNNKIDILAKHGYGRCKIKHNENVCYFFDGVFHNENGPAISCEDGSYAYFLYGFLHREDGPAIRLANGYINWALNGLIHREDGPAVEHPGLGKSWYFRGMPHREDGPAMEFYRGSIHYGKFFLYGSELTVEHHRKAVKIKDREYRGYYIKSNEINKNV